MGFGGGGVVQEKLVDPGYGYQPCPFGPGVLGGQARTCNTHRFSTVDPGPSVTVIPALDV